MQHPHITQRLPRLAFGSAACLAASLTFAAPAVMAQGNPPSTSTGSTAAVVGPVGAVDAATLNGKITAIDKSKRMATVQDDKGRTVTLYLGPNVANFDRLKVGDQVSARYTEAVVLAIAKNTGSDIRTKVEADAARMAPAGEKPGVSAMERTTVVANVVSVDPQKGRVTLKGIGSTPVDFRVRDKQALSKIKPDDQVVITYEQAAALAIGPGNGGKISTAAAGTEGATQKR
jgi:Cu/Ag efflux protein CusF